MAGDAKVAGRATTGAGLRPTLVREAGGTRDYGQDVTSAAALLSCLPDGPVGGGVLLADSGGVVRFCSESVARLAATSVGALTGKPIQEVLPGLPPPVQTGSGIPTFRALADGPEWRGSARLLHADGNGVPVHAALSVASVQPDGLVVVHLSWSEPQSESLQTLRRLAWVGERSAESVMVTDGNGLIEYVNPVFEVVTGYASAEVVGRPAAVLNSDTHDESFFRTLWHTIRAGRPFHALFTNRDKHGRVFHEDKSISPVLDSQGKILHFLSTGRDVTGWVRSMERLEYRVSHDPLTDLPSRALSVDRLEHALAYSARRAEAFVVAYLDIDRFKDINDSLGHAAGDTVLKEVARRLKACVRAEDTVARLHGDEFAIMLDVGQAAAAPGVLDKIVAAFQLPFRIADHIVPVTVSIGACPYPLGGKDSQTLLRRADGAMYQAKSAGGNGWRIFFDKDGAANRTEAAKARNGTSANGRARSRGAA
jgi:diguanylate cyclase (GGDEF)-like protein/PAS domain S-box-containing protein